MNQNETEDISLQTAEHKSNLQEEFLKTCKKHKMIMRLVRIFILLQFFIVWELLSDFNIIDSFFFSSPTRMVILFIKMYYFVYLTFAIKLNFLI